MGIRTFFFFTRPRKRRKASKLSYALYFNIIEIKGRKFPDTYTCMCSRSKLTRGLSSVPAVCPSPARARPQSFIHSGRGAGSFAQSFVHSIHQYSFFLSFLPSIFRSSPSACKAYKTSALRRKVSGYIYMQVDAHAVCLFMSLLSSAHICPYICMLNLGACTSCGFLSADTRRGLNALAYAEKMTGRAAHFGC